MERFDFSKSTIEDFPDYEGEIMSKLPIIQITNEQRQQLINYCQELCIWCEECGTLLEYSYEGELTCPNFKELDDNHTFMGSSYTELARAELISKLFNIPLEDMRKKNE